MSELTPSRLRTLLAGYSSLRVGVVGDFFLDAYFDCDPELDEASLETGRTCYQVVRHRRQAGAAGVCAHCVPPAGRGDGEDAAGCAG